MNDGQTTVIGGIYTSTQNNQVDRTPGLGQIPILKWLFQRERISDERLRDIVEVVRKWLFGK